MIAFPVWPGNESCLLSLGANVTASGWAGEEGPKASRVGQHNVLREQRTPKEARAAAGVSTCQFLIKSAQNGSPALGPTDQATPASPPSAFRQSSRSRAELIANARKVVPRSLNPQNSLTSSVLKQSNLIASFKSHVQLHRLKIATEGFHGPLFHTLPGAPIPYTGNTSAAGAAHPHHGRGTFPSHYQLCVPDRAFPATSGPTERVFSVRPLNAYTALGSLQHQQWASFEKICETKVNKISPGRPAEAGEKSCRYR